MANTYLKNKDLFNMLIHWRKTDEHKAGEKLAEYFYLIANNLIKKFYFTDVEKEELVQEAVLRCWEYQHKFDPNKSTSAFAYFTSTVYNVYRIHFNKEKRDKGKLIFLDDAFDNNWQNLI